MRRTPGNARTPISDPVSPNVPFHPDVSFHPDLDRRHSDSASMARLQLKETASALCSRKSTNEKHTYQNTELAKQSKFRSRIQIEKKLNFCIIEGWNTVNLEWKYGRTQNISILVGI